MENPLDTTTTAQGSSAAQIASLQRQVDDLERNRPIPASVSGASLAAIKAQLPGGAPNGTIIIGRIPSGGERCYLYVYEAAAGKWFRSAAFFEA